MSEIINGKWPKKDHLEEHKVMFDNLVSILADLENASKSVNIPIEIPKNSEGTPLWDQISVAYLIQWSLLNATKIKHEHIEDKNESLLSGNN